MIGKTHRLGLFAAGGAAAALLLGSGLAMATGDPGDHYKPAGVHVTGTATRHLTAADCGGNTPPPGTVTCFSVPANAPVLTVFCTRSIAGGTTPKTGLGAFNIVPLPLFDDGAGKPCTDNLGGHDRTKIQNTTTSWTIQQLDKAADEKSKEPNSGDRLQVSVPGHGAIVTNDLGCTITVNPGTKPFPVTGAYDDHSKFTVNIANLPVTTSGGSCPLPAAAVSNFVATYTFSPGVSDAS